MEQARLQKHNDLGCSDTREGKQQPGVPGTLYVSLDGRCRAGYVGIMARLARGGVPALRSHVRTGRPLGDWRVRGGPGEKPWPHPPPTQARSAGRPQKQTEINTVSPELPRHGSQAPRTAWGQVCGGAIPPAVPGACEPCQILSPRNSCESLPFWQFPSGSRVPVAGSPRCR